MDVNLQRRQAVRRKGFVWNKVASLSRLDEQNVGKNKISSSKLTRKRGSSLELAPSLLSIFDSIASANRSSDQHDSNQPIQRTTKADSSAQPAVQRPPTIKIDGANCDHSNNMEQCDVDSNSNKKRPLSISSVSSSSTSSLPRHTTKRPNLSEYDPRNSLRERMEHKLDNLLYIDADVTHGAADDEMLVDTDGENNNKNEQDSSSNKTQSTASLSLNDNLSKCEQSSVTNANDLDSSNRCHGNLNTSDVLNDSSSFSTPGSSFCHSPNTSFTPTQSPLVTGQGQTPTSTSVTPARNPSLRDTTSPQKYVSRVQRVVAEIVETEKSYVGHLKQIIEGYMKYLQSLDQQCIGKNEATCLFGNIQDIYEFSRNFSEQLDHCEGDPAKIAECFVRNNEGFAIYAEYCTNYPSAVEVLTKVMKDPFLSERFKEQQISLGHSLPLGAYLLKPVQRVLKYHLLLHNILKNFDKSDPGHAIVSQALDHMTGRAQHINEMKRKHEHAVRVQEIQSTLEDYEGEDLTRLGELVLESTFRTYNAKTSRHVFLFEKGVLIAKRKENAMLSCKVFIECSNLMLVESLPKEPLSFQVIPFDNPKGQHILQARNLDQKRKWCQEIKRLILESFKGKIPEKVKGLVMQLGKSKTEDSTDAKKFHHLAPDYLEKRQRMRRKSGGGGTLLTDILKPQRVRKAQKRAESVSPRVSPTMERKMKLTSTNSSASIYSKTMREGDECSIGGADDLGSSTNVAESDSASVISLSSQTDRCIKPKSNVGRSTSFRTAIRARPLQSHDYEDQELPPSPIHKTPESTPTRRTKSFKLATRLKPLLMKDFSLEKSSLPNSPSSPCTKLEFTETSNSSNDVSDQDHVFTDEKSHLKLSDAGKCSSLPVLNKTESAITRNRRSEYTPRLSNGSCNIGDLKQTPKKLIDARLYFSRSRDENPSISTSNDSEDAHNLRMEGKSVSAFHDTFIKKSTENIALKSPHLVTKAITLTKPLSVRNVLNSAYDRKGEEGSLKLNDADDPWIYNPSMTSMENLISDKENVRSPASPGRNRHHRTRSYGGEIDNDAPGNFDWIVYKNRNSLPIIDRRDVDDEQKLQTSMQRTHLSSNFSSDGSESTMISPRAFASENELDLNVTISGFHQETGSLPVVNKPPDKTVVQCRKQVKVSRSNSTPCARPDRYSLFRKHNRTQSANVDCLDDPEKLLAEMEDYMRRTESTATLSSQQPFPTRLAVSPEEVNEDAETNRYSYVSTVSSSSYESHESTDTHDSDGLVGTLKHRLQDLTKKIYRRSGSYDNKQCSGEELDDWDVEHAKVKPQESKTSLWSLNTWFSPKKESRPDLSTVLHAGDLGGPGIGSRMADPDPIYAEIEISQPRQHIRESSSTLPRQFSICYGTNPVSVSAKAETPKLDQDQNAKDNNVQNLNLQQSDSAFSIDLGDSTSSASDDSPRVIYSEVKEAPTAPVLKKADSFYEKRLSMAFNDNDVFRDSAVYCDADLDNALLSPTVSTPTETKPPLLPIKEYVQRLEEQTRQRPPLTTKVRQREPAEMIKQRLESLQKSCTRRSASCSRPCSEERELRRLSSIDSRRSSEEGELRRSSYSSSRSVSMDREATPLRFSLVNMDGCLKDSVVRTTDDHYRTFGRENSEPNFRGRSRSRSKSPGGTLKSASSTGRLDQLSSDVENLVIMKGWVRQLIDRFQPSSH